MACSHSFVLSRPSFQFATNSLLQLLCGQKTRHSAGIPQFGHDLNWLHCYRQTDRQTDRQSECVKRDESTNPQFSHDLINKSFRLCMSHVTDDSLCLTHQHHYYHHHQQQQQQLTQTSIHHYTLTLQADVWTSVKLKALSRVQTSQHYNKHWDSAKCRLQTSQHYNKH